MASAPMNDFRTLDDGVTQVLASIPVEGIWLRREGQYIVVLVERGKEWVEVMREHESGSFSHIIEPEGIRSRFATPDAFAQRNLIRPEPGAR